jgi:hypothetical protein
LPKYGDEKEMVWPATFWTKKKFDFYNNEFISEKRVQ